MARHIVRLKLALLRAGLAAVGIRGKVAFGISYLFAVIVGLFGASAFGVVRWMTDSTEYEIESLATVVFGLVFLSWVFGPAMTAASENTLEVDRLALFPLTRRELMTGLLLASMVGFGGLATVIALVGAIVGLAPASAGAVLTVLAVVLFFATCVATSRLATTALSAAIRKRRWRDLALTVLPLTFFFINFAMNGLRVAGAGSSPALRLLRVLPSGPSASAALAARRGEWVDAMVLLLAGVVVLVVLLWLWGLAVERVLTSAVESGGGRGQGLREGASLYPRWLRWLPRDRVGAVAAKELRLQWRDPRRRTGLISAAVFAILPLVSLRSQAGFGRGLVMVAVLPAVLLGINAINQYGFDGGAFWVHVAAGDDVRSDLVGKNLAIALVAAAVVVVEVMVLAQLSGGWALVVPALVLSAMALGVLLGVGNVTSVAMPVAMPDSTTNTWASNTSQGIQTMVPVLGAMILSAVVIGPFVALSLAWLDEPARLGLLMLVEAALGVAAWRGGLAIAAKRGTGRQAELLDALTRRSTL